MTALLAILVSGVLLNNMDVPMPEYHLVFADDTHFVSADNRKLIGVVTDKDGKFQLDLAPETYRLNLCLDDIDEYNIDVLPVDKNTITLKLKVHEIPPGVRPRIVRRSGRGHPGLPPFPLILGVTNRCD